MLALDDITALQHGDAELEQQSNDVGQHAAPEVRQGLHSEQDQMRLFAMPDETADCVGISDSADSRLPIGCGGMAGLAPRDRLSTMKLCGRRLADWQARVRDKTNPTEIRNRICSAESRLCDAGNHEIDASQVALPYEGPEGQVERFSEIVQNISEQMRIERALQKSQEELRRLSEILVTIQEDERRRIAMDLHDGLGQSLSLIKLAIENAAGQIVAGSSLTALESLRQLIPTIKEALHEVRRVATDLRPSILDDLGILPTLSWFFREFEANSGQIAVEKSIAIAEQDVPAPLKITIYRILQEAMSNIVNHSGADRVRISLERIDGSISLLIEDNGCGFDPASIICRTCPEESGRGLGLLSMKERAICSKGEYLFESAHGRGTRVQVSWPCASNQPSSSD
ncbi:MAG: sensor histidine kinase [Thiobacillaceae bacterium]